MYNNAFKFSPALIHYNICRVITAVGSQGLFMIPFMIIVEIIGPNSLVPLIPWRMQNKSLIGTPRLQKAILHDCWKAKSYLKFVFVFFFYAWSL